MKRRWSFKTGDHGHCVVVYERTPGGRLYARTWDRSLADGRGGWRRLGLRHHDHERARKWAREQAGKLVDGSAELTAGRPTWAMLFALYQLHRTPRKSASEQVADKRRVEMWTRVLGGGDGNPLDLSLETWEAFTDARRTGAIDAHGLPVAADARRPVRDRSLQEDLSWLKQVLNWGTRWKRDGHYVLRENPVRGYPIPVEENPRRPVATADRYEKLRAVAERAHPMLPVLLALAYYTGRRLSAICQLRYEDLRLSERPGSIGWPLATDKLGKAWSAPLHPQARVALDGWLAQHPGIGAAYLFTAATDTTKFLRKERASTWLRRAERLAQVPKMDGSLWHAFRRGWATSRKHLPDVDVAAAGGWKSTETLRRCYQRPDEASVLRVVLEPVELRERHA